MVARMAPQGNSCPAHLPIYNQLGLLICRATLRRRPFLAQPTPTTPRIVGSTCTNLWLGEAYCVKGPASSTSAAASAPTQTGIASNCNQYYTVVANDSCVKIETAYGITFAELYKWNPALDRAIYKLPDTFCHPQLLNPAAPVHLDMLKGSPSGEQSPQRYVL
ncbi:hypothetical protein HAV15_003866 [Penicillium sp. str. |nr:hypothetical protein HAV15_003866 [Penicillium sp. str. \